MVGNVKIVSGILVCHNLWLIGTYLCARLLKLATFQNKVEDKMFQIDSFLVIHNCQLFWDAVVQTHNCKDEN